MKGHCLAVVLLVGLLVSWPGNALFARSYKVTVGYEGFEIPLVVTPGQTTPATASGQISPDSPAVQAAFPAPVPVPTAPLTPNVRPPLSLTPKNPSTIGAQAFDLPDLAGADPMSQTLAQNGRVVVHDITFDKDVAVLRPEAEPALQAILAMLQRTPDLRLLIEGHTDNQGTNNPVLSQLRANAVRSWLIARGVGPTRLRALGRGASAPIDTNATPEGRANNRRVELVRE